MEKKKNNLIQYNRGKVEDSCDFFNSTMGNSDIASGSVSEDKKRKIEHRRINEGGLSRLYSHIKDQDTFAVIGSQDKDTGEDRSEELYHTIMNPKYKLRGFNWFMGNYKYEDGTIGREKSIILYNISKEDALRIGKKLNQETILWKDDNFFGYIYVDNGEVPSWNKGGFKGLMSFDLDKIEEIGGSSQLVNKGWSIGNKLKSKNKPFVYECFLIEPAMRDGYVSEYLIDSYTLNESNEQKAKRLFTNPQKIIEDVIKKVDISHLHDSEIKRIVRTNYKGTQKERLDFNYARKIDKEATLVKETDKAILLQLNYYTWNKERIDLVKKSILAWFPKSALLNSYIPHSNARVVENIGQLIKTQNRGIRESVEGYFTKKEINELPNELEKYFQEQKIPKYYSVLVNELEDGKYELQGIIDYGELNHDHKYFDEKAKDFFNEKGIEVNISEPKEYMGERDEDNIYSSIHCIRKI